LTSVYLYSVVKERFIFNPHLIMTQPLRGKDLGGGEHNMFPLTLPSPTWGEGDNWVISQVISEEVVIPPTLKLRGVNSNQ
jgi:hypothetical protein